MVQGSVTTERLTGLLDAVVAVSSDLSLEGVLQRIVDSASELVDARYGFLGVLDGGDERRLGTFAVHGLDQRHRDLIGRLPEGRGLLGLVIDHPEPIRVDDLREHPGRAGFPRLHPDMSSFLGVPIRTHDVVFGNLYLTDKHSGRPFTDEDEEIAVALAAAAGVAIENARLYEQGEQQRRWLAATADVATALLKPMSRTAAKQLIAERARDVSGAHAVAVLTPDDQGRLVVRAVSGTSRDLVGLAPDLGFLREVVETGHPVVVADVRGDERAGAELADLLPSLRSIHAQPMHLDEGTAVLAMGWSDEQRGRARVLDPALPAGFALQAALVLRVVRGQESQARLAVFEDRDRIGRDLHDLVIQRLFAIGLSLDSATRMVDPALAPRLSDAVDGLDQTIKEVRRTIFDLPSPLVPANLRLEIDEIVGGAERHLAFRPDVELRGAVEDVSARVAEQLVAVLHEALSNVVRHAGAQRVEVVLDVTGAEVELVVTDDGRGVDHERPYGYGLRNLRHRAQNLGGSCSFTRPPGGGLQVRWSVPKEPP